jgi:hypothetical protein
MRRAEIVDHDLCPLGCKADGIGSAYSVAGPVITATLPFNRSPINISSDFHLTRSCIFRRS